MTKLAFRPFQKHSSYQSSMSRRSNSKRSKLNEDGKRMKKGFQAYLEGVHAS